MNTIKQKDAGTIRVADITIGQLSRGLYRSTATAFKELVSNAYDADATTVRIDTNYPEFDFISCIDNGTGMSLEEFLRYFNQEGIGHCTKRKRARDTTEIYKRPIIGRLGIGMLAIGQLCHSFQIESHYKDEKGKGKAYTATLTLLDDTIPDRERIIRDDDVKEKKLPVGQWQYKVIDFDERKKGFRIYSSDVRPTFRQEMKESIENMTKQKRKKIRFSQSDLQSGFYAVSKSVRDCNPYLEAIWELSVLCPLPYYGKIEECPVNLSSFKSRESQSKEYEQAIQFLKNRQTRLLDYTFTVVVDGIELRRHIQLPTEKGTTPMLYFVDFDEEIFGSRLKFSGYLFAQIASYVKPVELNGIQIRLRNVGIGGYDHTFLKYYRHIPTIRNRWVSGELFVDEGLESALNIDRDSFNEHDEHFKKLQTILHDKFEVVFNKINAVAQSLQGKKRDKTSEKLERTIREMVSRDSQGKFKLVQSDLGKTVPIVTVNKKKGEIILNRASHPLRKKKANLILEMVEVAYRIAENTAETEKEHHEIFYNILKETLDQLV